jgi:hypothetical protein
MSQPNVANEFYPHMIDNTDTDRCIVIDTLNKAYLHSLTASSPRMPAPPEIKIPLKDHQEALLYEMESRETSFRNGLTCADNTTLFSRYAILADAVGSGKSLTVLSYIAHMKNKNLVTPQYIHKASTANFYSLWNPVQHPSDITHATLIIIPHSLYHQWSSYIKTQTHLHIAMCRTRKFFEDRDATMKTIRESDAILVSNTLYQRMHEFATANKIRWKRVFIDEADSIEIPATRPAIIADFTWFITATWLPMLYTQHLYITNATLNYYFERGFLSLNDMHEDFKNHILIPSMHFSSIFFSRQWKSIKFFKDFLSTHSNRHHLVVRSTDAFRDESLALQDYSYEILRCRSDRTHRIVNTLLSPQIKDMLNAGDVAGALKELGVEEATNVTLVDAVMINQKKELVRLEQTYAFKQGLEYSSAALKAVALESLSGKIQSLKEQIAAVERRVEEIDQNSCNICLDSVNNPVCVPCCKQIMCGACILEWLATKNQCPLCRTPISVKQLRQITKNAAAAAKIADKEPAQTLLRKSDTLLKLIRENPDGRFIVFSRYDNPFEGIAHDLNEMNVTVERVSGNADIINAIIRRFRNGSARVLLLNINNFAAGLNLEAASHIVLYHGNITPIERQQIIGRAQRLGRTVPLKVVHLLHEDE